MPTLNHGYITLLECTLATYSWMAMKKNPVKSELDRHQNIIITHVELCKTMITAELNSTTEHQLMVPRVREIFDSIKKGETVEKACHRFFLRVRYNKPEKV